MKSLLSLLPVEIGNRILGLLSLGDRDNLLKSSGEGGCEPFKTWDMDDSLSIAQFKEIIDNSPHFIPSARRFKLSYLELLLDEVEVSSAYCCELLLYWDIPSQAKYMIVKAFFERAGVQNLPSEYQRHAIYIEGYLCGLNAFQLLLIDHDAADPTAPDNNIIKRFSWRYNGNSKVSYTYPDNFDRHRGRARITNPLYYEQIPRRIMEEDYRAFVLVKWDKSDEEGSFKVAELVE